MVEPTPSEDIEIYVIAVAAFLAAYRTQSLATASSFMATAGFLGFSYGLSSRDLES